MKSETIAGSPQDGPAADFFYQSLIAELPSGKDTPELPTALTRWGEFDFDAQFVVYDRADIAEIASRLP